MKKRLFQTLDEMNIDDSNNGTRLVSISPTFLSVDKVKQGCKVAMGADEQVLWDIMNGKVIPILLVIDKNEYLRRSESNQ
jgi:hypothetical protein